MNATMELHKSQARSNSLTASAPQIQKPYLFMDLSYSIYCTNLFNNKFIPGIYKQGKKADNKYQKNRVF